MPPGPALLSRCNHDKINTLQATRPPQSPSYDGLVGRLAPILFPILFKAENMFLLLALLLILAWAGCFFLFHITAFLIHILLIFALISFIFHFISGRKAA